MKKLQNISVLAFALIASVLAVNLYAESKTTTGTTSSSLVFGSAANGRKVTSIDCESDKVGSVVTIKQATAAAVRYNVNGSGSASQAVIPLSATTGLASNDVIVVSCASGAPYKATLITVTSSNVTCDANLTRAVASGDRVFKMESCYVLAVGSNTLTKAASPIVQTRKDSPVLIELDSTAAGTLSANAE